MPVKDDDNWRSGFGLGTCFIKTSGKFVEFNGISEWAMSVPDEDDHANEVYATLPKDENVTFDFKLQPNAVSKDIYYLLTVGGGKRRIRKAVRMEEKIRRIEVKYGHKIFKNRFDRQRVVAHIMNRYIIPLEELRSLSLLWTRNTIIYRPEGAPSRR